MAIVSRSVNVLLNYMFTLVASPSFVNAFYVSANAINRLWSDWRDANLFRYLCVEHLRPPVWHCLCCPSAHFVAPLLNCKLVCCVHCSLYHCSRLVFAQLGVCMGTQTKRIRLANQLAVLHTASSHFLVSATCRSVECSRDINANKSYQYYCAVKVLLGVGLDFNCCRISNLFCLAIVVAVRAQYLPLSAQCPIVPMIGDRARNDRK